MIYKTLLFDLDGTLLNTIADLTAAVNHALAEAGYPTHSEAAIVRMVGNGVGALLARALPGGEENPDYAAVLAEFRRYYGLHKVDATAPYDGIPALLLRLHRAGYAMAIVSNKFDLAVKALAAQFFSDTVGVAVGESEKVAKKPAPDSVFVALRELGATTEGAAYIGDSEVDIETARNAGIPCLSVGWGFRPAAELLEKGADRVFATPEELADFLLQEDA